MTCEGGNVLTRSGAQPASTRRRRAAPTRSGSLTRACSRARRLRGGLARLFACETQHAGQAAHELFDLGFRHGGVVAERPQVRRHQGAVSLHALAQVHQGAGQIGQRPVEVGAPRLLHHLFQGVEAEMRDPQPDQVGDLRGVLAQVAGQREHRLGGADRVVEAPPGHLGTEPDLERRRQDLERPQLGRQRLHAAVLDALEGLPVERIQPGRPVRLPERRRRRTARSLSTGSSASGIVW